MRRNLLKMCLLLIGGTVVLPLAGQTPQAAAPQNAPLPVVKNTDIQVTGKYKIRHGYAEVICAEISGSKNPLANNEDRFDKSPFEEGKTCWAQIILMLPEKRGLSRFDFVLKSGSETYPCLAVAIGDTPYSMKEDAWILPEQRDVNVPVRLLFAVSDAMIAGNNGNTLVKLSLVRALNEDKTRIGADMLRFRLMPPDKDLTTAVEAKKFADEKGGSYGMTYEKMTKHAQEAAATATAPAAGPATTLGPLVK